MQDAFGIAHEVYAQCFAPDNHALTSISVTEQEVDFLRRHFSQDAVLELLESFTDEDPEDVVMVPVQKPYLILRGVALRDEDGKLLGKWVLMGVDENLIPDDTFIANDIRRTTEDSLDKAIILLSVLSDNYVKERRALLSLSDAVEKTKESGENLEEQLKKNEVMTGILKVMESDIPFSDMAEDILKRTGEYLSLSSCFLLMDDPEEKKTASITYEWRRSEDDSLKDILKNYKKDKIPFYNGKPYTVSFDAKMPEKFTDCFAELKIRAGIFLPIEDEKERQIYICGTDRGNRRFKTEEITFLNDVKRIIQTAIVKRETKESLTGSYNTLDAVLENVGCGIAVIDRKHHKFLYTNEKYHEINGTSDNEKDTELRRLLLSQKPEDVNRREYQETLSDCWYEITFEQVTWVDNSDVMFCTLYDITDNKIYQRRIERQANTDDLTDLPNKKKFEKDLAREIRTVIRQNEKSALFYIDLDDFKQLNDGRGRAAGDDLLKEVSKELIKVAGYHIQVYRTGGDEFAMIIPSSETGKTDTIRKKLTDVFKTPWEIGEEKFYCTMSMGIVSIPDDGRDYETLMQKVDYALRLAKRSGKNHPEEYKEVASTAKAYRPETEALLREAVQRGCGEFEVYFRPIVESRPGLFSEDKCIGAEASVRWKNDKLGELMPADFLPLAEYLSLGEPIGKKVVREACRKCRYWNDFGHPEYIIHINPDILRLLGDNATEIVKKAIEDSGLIQRNLMLEVLNGYSVCDMNAMQKIYWRPEETPLSSSDFEERYVLG